MGVPNITFKEVFYSQFLKNKRVRVFDTLTLPIESSLKFQFQPPGRPIKTPVKVPTHVRLVLTAVKSERSQLGHDGEG